MKDASKRKSGAERSRQHRARNRRLVKAVPQIVPFSTTEHALRLRKLVIWLSKGGMSQAKLIQHKSAPQILQDWRRFQAFAAKYKRTPTPTEFGRVLKVDRHAGRNRLRRLAAMEQPGGPWEDCF